MAELDTNAVFTQYLNVLNRSLGAHRDDFPYQQIISAAEELLEDKDIGVAIYEDEPDNPHDYFTISFEEGSFEIEEHGKESPDVDWRVSESYLREVIQNEEEYVEHPDRLNIDWLKARLNLT